MAIEEASQLFLSYDSPFIVAAFSFAISNAYVLFDKHVPPEMFRKQKDEIFEHMRKIDCSKPDILVSFDSIIIILYVNFMNHVKEFTLFLLSGQKIFSAN